MKKKKLSSGPFGRVIKQYLHLRRALGFILRGAEITLTNFDLHISQHFPYLKTVTKPVVGVSGSGKTCIIVKRAVYLAEKYPDSKILVLTLNRSLASLIEKLMNHICLDGVRDRIEVYSFWKFCQRELYKFEPDNKNYMMRQLGKSMNTLMKYGMNILNVERIMTMQRCLHR